MTQKKESWFFRFLKGLMITVLGAASCALALAVLWGQLSRSAKSGEEAHVRYADQAVMDKYDMFMTNEVSDALEGVMEVEKVYWLRDEDIVAPEPDQSCFGTSTEPAELQWLLDEAAQLLDIEEFVFHTGIQIVQGTQIHYYLDETIFVITWQEAKDSCLYTMSEVKIADASQMRRFLAGGTYGYDKQYLTTEMSAEVNAVVASSGDYYQHRKLGIVVYDGKVYRSSGETLDTCFIDDNGDMILVDKGELTDEEEIQKFVEDNNIRFSLSFGPILIRDGVRCDPLRYWIGEVDQQFPRAALCQMDERHYLLAVACGVFGYGNLPRMRDFALRLEELGCDMAYALDGGQTGVIVMNDERISPIQYDAQRRISDILYFATALPDGE